MGIYGVGIYGSGVYGGDTDIALTVQDVYPDRVQLVVTENVSGTTVTIWRRVLGETARTAVRGADHVVKTDSGPIIAYDHEAPYGVGLEYLLEVSGIDLPLETETVTLTLEGGKVAITDAISGMAAETVILAWPDKDRARPATVFQVDERNIAVLGPLVGFTSSIEFYCETKDARENLVNVLSTATQGIVQLRGPGGAYDDVDCYLAVLGLKVSRWSQDGSDPRRVVTAEVVEVENWASTLGTKSFTLGDIAAALPSPPNDLQDLADMFPGGTLLDIALADWS